MALYSSQDYYSGTRVKAAPQVYWLSSVTTNAHVTSPYRNDTIEREPRLNSAFIRRVNAARVFHALRDHPGMSQRGLCALTQLDASTEMAG